MRPRWRSSLLLIALTALLLGQGGTPLENPRVRQLGDQLACLCGCGSSVTSCNMLHCHFSDPARQKLLALRDQFGRPGLRLGKFGAQSGERRNDVDELLRAEVGPEPGLNHRVFA